MKLGVFTVLYNEKPLEEVAKYVAGLGYDTVELAAWRASNHLDIDKVLADKSYRANLLSMLKGYNLEISAISNHLDGQMILGPLDWTTDAWAPVTAGSGARGPPSAGGTCPTDGARPPRPAPAGRRCAPPGPTGRPGTAATSGAPPARSGRSPRS